MNAKEYSFRPTGETHLIAADAVAPAGIQVSGNSPSGSENYDCYLLYNESSNTIHVGWGSSATQAQANSVEVTSGSPARSIPIPAGAGAVFRFSKDTFFSGLATSASKLYITPGEGV